ncbi:MAG: hypothetical protein ACFE8Z_03665 [Candidatus Hermodarchaeota archaeon]
MSKAYSGIQIDMDLIAPFLSATHMFIDETANETLRTIDTATNRYIWEANDHLLFVMVVSKAARVGHMRFLLKYAMNEFMTNEVPVGMNVETVLKEWHGAPTTFREYGEFVDELVGQYEETDESLMAGKSMDCLSVYSHLYRAIMRVDIDKKTRRTLVRRIKKQIRPLTNEYAFLSGVTVDGRGIEVLGIDVYNVPYKILRQVLEELLRHLAEATKATVTKARYRKMVFEHAMPYVKEDIERMQTYAILDDVVRHLF